MSLLSDFVSDLTTTLPTVQLHPVVNKTAVYPSGTFSVRDGLRTQFYVDSEGLRTTNLVLNLYSKSYSELQTLKDAVTTRYHGLSGVVGSTTIQRVIITNLLEDTTELPTNDTLYRCIIDLDIID
jgi:hypothetical protein